MKAIRLLFQYQRTWKISLQFFKYILITSIYIFHDKEKEGNDLNEILFYRRINWTSNNSFLPSSASRAGKSCRLTRETAPFLSKFSGTSILVGKN